MEKEKHFRAFRGMQRQKKHHDKMRIFFEFETKRKIKWQAYWRPIQSVVSLLHRIDGIVSIVTSYFSQTFIFT